MKQIFEIEQKLGMLERNLGKHVSSVAGVISSLSDWRVIPTGPGSSWILDDQWDQCDLAEMTNHYFVENYPHLVSEREFVGNKVKEYLGNN